MAAVTRGWGLLLVCVLFAGCESRDPAARRQSGEPDLVLSVTQVDFGEVWLGAGGEADVELTNPGQSAQALDSVTTEGEAFHLVGTVPAEVPAQDTVTVPVRFEPPQAGDHEGRLVVTSGARTWEVALAGRCAVPPGCDDGNPCTADRFDLEAGACLHPPRSGPCDDGEACTEHDRCVDGACVPGTWVCDDEELCTPGGCDDGDPCTTDTCNPAVGCEHAAVADGTACGLPSACAAPVCRGGSCMAEPVADGTPCGPAAGCSVAQCHAGACLSADAPDGTACDDGSACTVAEACTGGRCAGEPLSCDDANACTADRCDPEEGCVYEALADGTLCGPESGCDALSACDDGACIHWRPAPDGTACDDGDLCTTGDRCQGGVCEGTASALSSSLDAWRPTWLGADGVAVLPDGRLLLADVDRLTLVDASAGPAGPVAAAVEPGAGFQDAAALGESRIVVIRRRGTGELPVTRLTVHAPSGGTLTVEGAVELDGVAATRVVVAGSVAYLVDGTKGRYVDLSQPSAPRLATTIEFGVPVDLAHDPATGRLLALGADGVLTEHALDDPLAPRPLRQLVLLTCEGTPRPVLRATPRTVLALCQSTAYPPWAVSGSGAFLDAAELTPLADVPFADQVFANPGFLDDDHLGVITVTYSDSQSHGACMPIAASHRLQVFDRAGALVLDRDQGTSGNYGGFWPFVRWLVPGPGLVVEQAMGRLERWTASPAGLTEVAVREGGPPGRLARHGGSLQAEGPRSRHRLAVDTWPALRFAAPTTYRARTEAVVSPVLVPGPLLTVDRPATHQLPPGCFYAPHETCRVHLDTSAAACTRFEPASPAQVTEHVDAQAAGPHLLLARVLGDELVLEVLDEAGLGPVPALPLGRVARSASCAWSDPEVMTLAGDGAVAGLGATCDAQRVFLLVDTSTAAAPGVVFDEVEATGLATRGARLAGERLARLRGTGSGTVLQVSSVDRLSSPWRLQTEAEFTLPEAEHLLLFDGRVALVGGPAAASAPDARGTLWVVSLATAVPAVTALPVPVAPDSALALPDGILVGSPGGVGAVTLSCGAP